MCSSQSSPVASRLNLADAESNLRIFFIEKNRFFSPENTLKFDSDPEKKKITRF